MQYSDFVVDAAFDTRQNCFSEGGSSISASTRQSTKGARAEDFIGADRGTSMMRFRSKLSSQRKPLRWLGLAVLALALSPAVAPARAGTVPFATFSQPTGNPFSWTTSTVGGTTTGTFSGTSEITFNFTSASGLPTNDIAATLVLNATTTMAAVSFGSLVVEPITTGTLSITDNSNSQTLLHMDFSGALSSVLGSTNANLAGDSANGNTVSYSSQFPGLFFNAGGSFNIQLPTLSPSTSINTNTGFLNPFTTSAYGTFTGSLNAVPLPASIAMLGTGIMAPASLALLRRFRRRSVPATTSA